MKQHSRRILAVTVPVFLLLMSFVCGIALKGNLVAAPPDSSALAPNPPMGWNSWDSYGETVSEKDFREIAHIMAERLKPHGWQYVVVDMGWYVTNHEAGSNTPKAQFSMDSFGRLLPPANTFPSAANGVGFKPLADYVHSLGLKFGIHILRGIPREAVTRNLPIAGSGFHAADAADTADACPWNTYMYGLKTGEPAAQAYYDSIAHLYADWGVDFIKVDCIASHPYKPGEIRLLSNALRKVGRPILLSLSPGPAPLDKAQELSHYANMWRISNDVWDIWHTTSDFPRGPGNQFELAAKWAATGVSGPGHWPDADMLPFGSLKPAPGWGDARESRLTHDEQRTQFTLWCIFRSPLMMGGNLLALPGDSWTTALLTNDEVIAVDQHSNQARAVVSNASEAIWLSRPDGSDDYYLAAFNLETAPQTIHSSWKDLGLPAGRYSLRDLWELKDLPAADSLNVALPPHGSVLYRLKTR